MKTVEQEALDRINASLPAYREWLTKLPRREYVVWALCRLIEEHRAFRQQVSDDVRWAFGGNIPMNDRFAKYIIPPANPAKQVKALMDAGMTLEDALAEAGAKIVEASDDQ